MAVALLLPACGCKLGTLVGNDKKYDLLEAELRTREREIHELRGDLQYFRQLNQTYQRQNVAPQVWGDPGDPQLVGRVLGGGGATPVLPLKEITLGSGTGGVDEDGKPGDESLMVVVVPRDDDGTAVKVPGQAVVSAYEVSPQGIKSQIGQWNVSPEQMRRAWKGGLLSTGYFVPLQWDRLPATGRLRVVVRFTSNDGQGYEADKDVTVRPLPGQSLPHNQPGALPPGHGPTPTVSPPRFPNTSDGAEELPPPRDPSAEPAARFRLRQ